MAELTRKYKAAKPDAKLVPQGFKMRARKYNAKTLAGRISVEGWTAVPDSFEAAAKVAGPELALSMLQTAWMWKAQHGKIADLVQCKDPAKLQAEVDAHSVKMIEYKPMGERKPALEVEGVKISQRTLAALAKAGMLK